VTRSRAYKKNDQVFVEQKNGAVVRRRNGVTRNGYACPLTSIGIVTIESWLATEPQITALAIVRRLAAIDPATFCDKQHSIVQRLIRLLRRKATETVIAAMATQVSIQAAMRKIPGGAGPGFAQSALTVSADQISGDGTHLLHVLGDLLGRLIGYLHRFLRDPSGALQEAFEIVT
jgi:hypothetical protein